MAELSTEAVERASDRVREKAADIWSDGNAADDVEYALLNLVNLRRQLPENPVGDLLFKDYMAKTILRSGGHIITPQKDQVPVENDQVAAGVARQLGVELGIEQELRNRYHIDREQKGHSR